MDNLGQYLRSLREDKHLSLDAVQREIKLSLDQLNAIENNQLTKLGNHGFARAMVYTYIRFLEADEKRAMYLFDLSLPPLKQTNFTPRTPIKEKKVLISTNFIWLISIIILAIILGSIIWISYTKGYLERPFDKKKLPEDSLKTEKVIKQKVEKPDTLRHRMLELTKNQNKAKIATEKVTKSKKTAGTPMKSDSTDYVDDLIFDTKESPFNSRF